MKALLSILLSLGLNVIVLAQMVSMQIYPSEPNSTDSLMVVMDFSYAGVNCDYGIVYNYYIIQGDVIAFRPEFCPDISDSTFCEVSDTLWMPPVEVGAYTINLFVGLTGQCPIGNNYTVLDTLVTSLVVDLPDAVDEIDVEMMGIQVFPNPVNEVLFINQESNRNLSVNIYATDGRLVYTEKLLGQLSNKIQLEELPSGLYLLALIDLDSGEKASEPFIKN